MSFPKYKELQNLITISAVEQEIFLLQKNLFDLKMKRSTVNTVKPHLFKHVKRRIAQLNSRKAFLVKLKQ
jgi:ribosomal protein L29